MKRKQLWEKQVIYGKSGGAEHAELFEPKSINYFQSTPINKKLDVFQYPEEHTSFYHSEPS